MLNMCGLSWGVRESVSPLKRNSLSDMIMTQEGVLNISGPRTGAGCCLTPEARLVGVIRRRWQIICSTIGLPGFGCSANLEKSPLFMFAGRILFRLVEMFEELPELRFAELKFAWLRRLTVP